MKRSVLAMLLLLAACKSPFERSTAKLAPTEATDLDPAADVVRVALSAARLVDGAPYIYAYNGVNPGPTIRANVGDTLIVELTNDLDDPTTIHWHGVAVPFAMDGVTWMRDPVMPGETFTYRFVLPVAGTFFYHPHFDTKSQVEGGLYGALVVRDPAEPTPDVDIVLVVDAVDELLAGGHARGHGKRTTRWRVNGVEDAELSVLGGSTVRARIVNASNAGFLALRWPNIRHIASDQGLLPALETPDRLLLGPGDRADVELLVGRDDFTIVTEPYSLNGGEKWGDAEPLVRVTVDTPAAAPAPLAWPFPGGVVTANPGHVDIVYAFAGSDRTRQWMINGERFPNVTIESIPLGEVAIVDVLNLSPTEHPFHIHGLRFEVLDVNGAAPARRTIEDTINLKIRDRVRLRVEADNPGDWMTHCHILPHADDGMMTVLRVE